MSFRATYFFVIFTLVFNLLNSANADLVAYYPMDENSGTSIADSSGNSHNGILTGTGAEWVDGKSGFGKALKFPGTSTGPYVDLGKWNPAEGTGQLSISVWIKWEGKNDYYQGIVSKRDNWSNIDTHFGLSLWQEDGNINFARYDCYPWYGTNIPPIHQWQHIVITFDGTTAILYVNGTEVGQSNDFSFGPKSNASMVIGASDPHGYDSFNGTIDEVRIYNNALTSSEVYSLFDHEIQFEDSKLKAAVEGVLGVTNPTQGDMLNLKGNFEIQDKGITSLKGLESAINLQSLWAWNNRISDLSPLEGLTGLTYLYLDNNRNISDLTPLANLTKLIRLSVPGNKISQIDALSGLTNIDQLRLENNQITDINSLANMTKLEMLWFFNNQVSDISVISSLTNLVLLDISNNDFSDISALAGLNDLEELWITGCSVSDISPLAGLTKLKTLGAWNNTIQDITALKDLQELVNLQLVSNNISDISPLVNLTKLEHLNMNDNYISDLSPLTDLTLLEELYIDNGEVNDISYLSNLNKLRILSIAKHQISDISVLAGLTDLTVLWCYNNQITDISALQNLNNLIELYAQNNQITDIGPLSGLTGITRLNLWNNSITDLSPLANLTKLEFLNLNENYISDLSPLKDLTLLEELYIDSGEVNDISYLSKLIKLRRLSIAKHQISDISVLDGLTDITNIWCYDNQINDISSLENLNNLQKVDMTTNPLMPENIPVIVQIETNNPGVELLYDPIQPRPNYAGGFGTPEDPYQIADAETLIDMGQAWYDWDKHFVLTSDIDLDGYTFASAVIAADSQNNWERFTGTFDGQGHTITNLNISGESYIGLFGRILKGSIIRNINVFDSNVSSSSDLGRAGILVSINYGQIENAQTSGSVFGNYAGGVVGYNVGVIMNSSSSAIVTGNTGLGGLAGWSYGNAIINCFSTGSVEGNSYVGGLTGANQCYILNCYSSASVKGNDNVGGLIGGRHQGAALNCYAIGSVDGNDLVGGLIGQVSDTGSVSSCYSTGQVTGGTNTGGLVGKQDSEGCVTNSFWDINTSGQLVSAGGTGLGTNEMQSETAFLNAGWDFIGETTFGHIDSWQMPTDNGYPILTFFQGAIPLEPDGQGTPESPYWVSNARELTYAWFEPFACYTLDADIDLSSMNLSNAMIPWFSGIIDGNDHIISNLTINEGGYLGLIGSMENGYLKNLTLENLQINGTGPSVGGLLGDCDSSNETLLEDCFTSGLVTGGRCVGGIVGDTWGITLSNCHSTCSVSGYQYVGGLVGENVGFITQCSFNGTVIGQNNCVGGLVGWHYIGSVLECSSTGTVIGNNKVGGLVGVKSASAGTVNSYSQSIVDGNDGVGGLIGINRIGNSVIGVIYNTYSTGMVTGNSNVGGLVGLNEDVSNCENNFWDIETSGTTESDCGYGLITSEIQDINTFLDAGWDFTGETGNGAKDIWMMPPGGGYPILNPDANLSEEIYDEDFESFGFYDFDWQLSEDQLWKITSLQANTGHYSAQCGPNPGQGLSTLELTYTNDEPGDISFFIKTDLSIAFSFLVFSIDDQFITSWGRENGWTEFSFPVSAGEHTYKWSYSKLLSDGGESDKVWLDSIRLP